MKNYPSAKPMNPWNGAVLGLKTGWVLCVLFSPTLTPFPRGGWHDVSHYLKATLEIVWNIGFLYGGILAMIWGCLTGFCIALLVKRAKNYFQALAFSCAIACIVIFLLEPFFGGIQALFRGSIIYFYPYLLYFLGALWMGERLYKREKEFIRFNEVAYA